MQYKTQNELRQLFLDFFASKDHYVAESASLIPEDDPSVLLIGAGMAPLKKYFTGVETPPRPRMATCQKCIRIGDLENVGRTARHLTFFEMLGNFSFGDYFKQESLAWGLEFVEEWLGIPRDQLWASIYEEDDDAYEIWVNKLNFPAERIVRLGKEDNFWEIGLGPCGPCSEIYIDRGEAFGCGHPDCKPGCDCDRFLEFWNHVFTQFNKEEDGSYTALKNKNIDTGMGLERLAVIVQQVDNVFETDTMVQIIHKIEELTGSTYGETEETNRLIRIVTDHIRSITFMVGDGVIPSNEGRGYVLRKLLRRAALQMKKLGVEEPMLDQLALKVMQIYGDAYPLIVERKEVILKMIRLEEEKFHLTLRKGLNYIDNVIRGMSGGEILSGEEAFRLYDTFGFPVSLSEEILRDAGISLDMEGFMEKMSEQRAIARASTDHEADSWQTEVQKQLALQDKTSFVGYEEMTSESIILDIIRDGVIVDTVLEGESATLILDQTPFYATGGGQLGDIGTISYQEGIFTVEATEKKQDLYFHHGFVKAGFFTTKETVIASVDARTRLATARNHTATHLLHKALERVLGAGATQAGSMVDSERLRFDFNYFQSLTQSEIQEIEQIVNQAILEDHPLETRVMPLSEAKKEGAKALFSEKYGDTVRVVSIKDYSKEFCGGTHVSHTSQIALFKILYERGIASGVRRIEALTGKAALDYLNHYQTMVKVGLNMLKTEPEMFENRLQQLVEEVSEHKREIARLKDQANRDKIKEMKDSFLDVDGVHQYVLHFKDMPVDDLKNMADNILAKDRDAFVLLLSTTEGKIALVASSSEKAQSRGYKAGKIISAVAKELGGGGGGRDHFASAGAKDVSKIDAFMANRHSFIKNLL